MRHLFWSGMVLVSSLMVTGLAHAACDPNKEAMDIGGLMQQKAATLPPEKLTQVNEHLVMAGQSLAAGKVEEACAMYGHVKAMLSGK